MIGLFLGLRICRRCRPDMPPQMPTQFGISSAYSRQSCLTGQVLQMFLAWCVGSPRSGNQSRVGWCLHAACRIHSAGGAMKDAKSSMVIWCLLLLSLGDVFLSLDDVSADFTQESVVVWSWECVAPLAACTFAVAHRCVPFGVGVVGGCGCCAVRPAPTIHEPWSGQKSSMSAAGCGAGSAFALNSLGGW